MLKGRSHIFHLRKSKRLGFRLEIFLKDIKERKMTLKEWQKQFGDQKIEGMHGVYDSYDMQGRIVVREVYIEGKRVITISPIRLGEEEVLERRRKRKGKL